MSVPETNWPVRGVSIVVPVLLSIALGACTLVDVDRRVNDGGFISGEPCGPPCFMGIEPGTSTSAAAEAILKEEGFWSQCERFDNQAESGGRGIICRPSIVVVLRGDGDLVQEIGFNPSIRVTLHQAIDAHGEPDWVTVVPAGTPEDLRSVMLLYFNEIRTSIRLTEQNGRVYIVAANQMIENIAYFDVVSFPSGQPDRYPWKGYGDYPSEQ